MVLSGSLARPEGGDRLLDKVQPHLRRSIDAALAKKGRPYAGRPFLVEVSGSAAVAEGRGDRADGGLLLDVVHPLVVTNVSLRGAGEPENRGRETTGDDGSKSELLHFDAFFFSVRFGRFGPIRAGLTD